MIEAPRTSVPIDNTENRYHRERATIGIHVGKFWTHAYRSLYGRRKVLCGDA
jgi:hypothetical protein